MRTQGDTKPELYYYLQGGIIININEEEKTGTTMDGEYTYWEYDSIKVSETPNKAEITNSIIYCKYTPDAETAAINNYNTGESKYITEYQNYQMYRTFAKTTADNILSEI
jgi:hypothetical protein